MTQNDLYIVIVNSTRHHFFTSLQTINRRSTAALLYSATNKKMTHPFRRQTSNEDQRRWRYCGAGLAIKLPSPYHLQETNKMKRKISE